MDELDRLTGLAAELGANIRLVQGAGGNVSLKDSANLWVKASGTWLADAHKRPIFVRLDLLAVRSTLAAGSDDFSGAIKDQSGLRPSIETSLHALMAQRVVVHVHSINALSWAVRHDGKSVIEEKLAGLEWAWVDYVRPGLPLTRAVRNALAMTPEAAVLVLANHGLVVAADTVEEVRDLLLEVERRLHQPGKMSDMELPSTTFSVPVGCRLPVNGYTNRLAGQDYIGLLKGALYPDHVVFLGEAIPVLATAQETEMAERANIHPYCVALAGKGMVLGEKFSAGSEAMLECLALLAPLLPERDRLRFLAEAEMAELLNWDAEKVRQKANL